MTAEPAPKKRLTPPDVKNEFESTALLLQGGGALGSYQAGVYEALAAADVAPDWVAGISIGAINGAIIAGNHPTDRVAKLRGFWERITALSPWGQFGPFNAMVKSGGTAAQSFWNEVSAGMAMAAGAPGFFTPRMTPPWLLPNGAPGATSFYDTTPLRQTLLDFVDFKVLNAGDVRFTISAVEVTTGNFTIFDSREIEITPEHVMASGALPPALPAVEIDGRYYWDGGLVSNAPLLWVMDEPDRDTLVFQVDLWSADGAFPHNMLEVATRQKEIQYSSRTRAVTNRFKQTQKMRHAFATLYEQMPDAMKNSEEAKLLIKYSDFNHYNIVQLIYHAGDGDGYSKDFEFSRGTMENHWKAGYNDTLRSLRHKRIFQIPADSHGVATFDFSQEG